MPVYDDQDKRTTSDQDLRNITGINEEQEGAMDREAKSGAASDIRARENAAAAGKTDAKKQTGRVSALGSAAKEAAKAAGSGAGAGGALAAGLGALASRNDLKDKESGSGFYNPSGDKPAPSLKQRIRKRIAVAALVSGVMGGGAGFGLFGAISGPLQFVHAGQLLSAFHLEEKGDQMEGRLVALARYIRFAAAGTPERSRLGYLGNKYADRVEQTFNRQGIKSAYTRQFGFLRAYTIDPSQLRGGDFEKIQDRSPQGVADFLRSEYGITATVHGNEVRIDTTQNGYNYKINKRFTRAVLQAGGMNGITRAISARFAGQRSGLGRLWHPIEKIDRKVMIEAEKRWEAWQQKKREAVSRGSGPVRPAGLERRTDEDGNPIDDADRQANQIQETLNDAQRASSNPQEMAAFKEKLRGRLGTSLGILGLVDLLCLLMYISDNIDKLNQQNIIDPSKRLGMWDTATGSQVQNGTDLDGETEQLGWHSELMFDPVSKTSYFDAMSINAELGKGLVGKDIPESARVDPEDNIIGQIFGVPGVRDTVQTVCAITGSVLGVIVLTGASIVFGGLVATAIQIVVAAIALPILIDFIAERLAGKEIDPMVAGVDRGNIANYGMRHFGNDMAMSMGGLPLSDADSLALREINAEEREREFQEKSLAYRLFEPNDPQSFIGQVIDSQRPDPAANVAKFATGFLDIGKSFGSIFTKPLTSVAGAAPLTPYDYGFPEFGFTQAEMEDNNYEDGFINEGRAIDLLDSPEGPEFVRRAQICFGVTLEKRAINDPDAPERTEQYWSIRAPIQGATPMYKTVQTGVLDDQPYANCLDQSAAWKTIRFYIIDSQAMNSYVCYEGDATSQVTKQACIDIGMESSGGGGTGGGYSGQAIPAGDLPGWKQIFADDFTIPAAVGSWGSDSDSRKIVYKGTGPVGETSWQAYPKTFRDTYDDRPYRSDAVLSVQNHNLVFHLHNVDGQPAGANPSPVLPAAGAGAGPAAVSRYQTYGRYGARFKVEKTQGDMSEYYLAWLLWPVDHGQGSCCAESDYPEGRLSESETTAFHHSTGGQESFSAPVDFTQWHNYIQEWEPGVRRYYLDDKLIGTTSNAVWDKSERWQLQTETKGNGNSDGYLYVDWVVVYCHIASGCKIGE